MFQTVISLRAKGNFDVKEGPLIFPQGMAVITFFPPPADSPLWGNSAVPCPTHSFVFGYFVKGFHKEMFFNKKHIEAVEGNKLVGICEFGKTRKMCSQRVIMCVQKGCTCHPASRLHRSPSFLCARASPCRDEREWLWLSCNHGGGRQGQKHRYNFIARNTT